MAILRIRNRILGIVKIGITKIRIEKIGIEKLNSKVKTADTKRAAKTTACLSSPSPRRGVLGQHPVAVLDMPLPLVF